MGILIGVDFFPGIKGIGQHKALDLIKEYRSIKNMVQEKVKIRKNMIDIDLDTIHQIKEIFLNPDVKKVYPKLKCLTIDPNRA